MPVITKLKNRLELAEGTVAFYFERPDRFQFEAGQFVELSLVNPSETDDKGNSRAFTIASAPFERDLMIATRIRDSAFKRQLEKCPIGTGIELDGPFGAMTLHKDGSRHAVFMAGGIGITPFRSIALQATRDGSPHHLFIFYSNRRPEDAPFLRELSDPEQQNPNFKLVATMTAMEKSSQAWDEETGPIDRNMLSRYLGNLNGPIYYIAGPPAMVTAMRKLLREAGVASTDIRSEEFVGY